MAVRTTVVGSWWPHADMEKDLARHHAGKLSEQESESLLKRAAAKAIQEQRDLGLENGPAANISPTTSSCTCTNA